MLSLDGHCGGILTDEVGIISPVDRNKNGFYDNNLNCWWAIVAPQHLVVEYGFVDLEIEYHPNCDNDYILVSYRPC